MYLNTVFKYNVFKYCPALVSRNSHMHTFEEESELMMEVQIDESIFEKFKV